MQEQNSHQSQDRRLNPQQLMKEDLFQSRMSTMKSQELTNLLKCTICKGLYRLAHTILDCGHTYCQICLFTYIKSFTGRNPIVKCPQCHGQIDSNYNRSIMKDVFKQSLVDMLEPSYSTNDEIIIGRLQKLFPEEDLEFLLDEYKFTSCNEITYKKKKDSEKHLIMGKLVEKIKTKLNISFETFSEQIADEKKFSEFMEIMEKCRNEPVEIVLIPKTYVEIKNVGIKGKFKIKHPSYQKLKYFLQKRLLKNLIEKEIQNPESFYDQQKGELQKVDIELYDEYHEKLCDEDNLRECDYPIYYCLV